MDFAHFVVYFKEINLNKLCQISLDFISLLLPIQLNSNEVTDLLHFIFKLSLLKAI